MYQWMAEPRKEDVPEAHTVVRSHARFLTERRRFRRDLPRCEDSAVLADGEGDWLLKLCPPEDREESEDGERFPSPAASPVVQADDEEADHSTGGKIAKNTIGVVGYAVV